MACSTPCFPVPHHLLEFAQVHVHWIGDAIQPSHPLCPLLLLPSIFPSISNFSNELAICIRYNSNSSSIVIYITNEHVDLGVWKYFIGDETCFCILLASSLYSLCRLLGSLSLQFLHYKMGESWSPRSFWNFKWDSAYSEKKSQWKFPCHSYSNSEA